MPRKHTKRPYLRGEPPPWRGEFEGWAVNFANRNAWRVAPDFLVDDIVQECGLVFHRVITKYPRTLQRPQYMALFKRACWNRLHDLANSKRRRVEAGIPVGGLVAVDAHSGEEVLADSRPNQVPEEALLAAAVSEAPEEVQTLLRNAMAGQGGYRRLSSGRLETRSELIVRLLGGAHSAAGEHIVRAWFSEELGLQLA